MSTFKEFELDGKILKALEELGYITPTPIQDQAIPKALEGLDLLACAQTGTGKTAAFMLPILDLLANEESGKFIGPKILVLVPTRELAMQVAVETKKFSTYMPEVKTACIYGGVPYPVQKRTLETRYDILVATPGRLIDYMERGKINLSNIKILVLDEADRMLDMGFRDAVEHISAATPATRQTLLFSATIDNKILPFSKKLQKKPFEIRIEPDHSAKANIEQSLYYVDNIGHKVRILEHILENTEIVQAIVFTSTKSQADDLSNQLQDMGQLSAALHGDMNQRQRTRTIDRLRRGNIKILVATDVAARGIDIASLSHVINFDLPYQPEDFIHRIGRTGRAGASGNAITFATYRENRLVSRISQMMGKPLNEVIIEGLEPQKDSYKGGGGGGGRRQDSRSRDRGPRSSGPSRRDGDSFRSERSDRAPSDRGFSSDRGDRAPRFNHDAPKGDRPPRFGGDAPRGGDRGDRAPRFGGDAPRGDRPPRFGGDAPRGDRPPRFNHDAPRGDRPPRFGGDAPRGDRPPRFNHDAPRGDRPPRFGGDAPRGDRAPRFGGEAPRGDRPPRFGGDAPRGDRPPRFNHDAPRGDRAPRFGGDAPRGDRPPRAEGGKPFTFKPKTKPAFKD